MSNGLINRQYVGARYVPKIMGEWNKALQYEALSVVTYMGNSFTSKVPVPANVKIDNTDYWVNTGNYNAQVEEYRQLTIETANNLNKKISKLENRKIIMIGDSYGVQNDGSVNTFYWEFFRDALGLTDGINFFHSFQSGAGFGNEEYLYQLQNVSASITDKDSITDILVCGGWNDSDKSQTYGSDEAFNNGILHFKAYIEANYPTARMTLAHISWGNPQKMPTVYSQMKVSIQRYNEQSSRGWRILNGTEHILHRYDPGIWQKDNAHPSQLGQGYLGMYLPSAFLSGSCGINYFNNEHGVVSANNSFVLNGNIRRAYESLNGDIYTVDYVDETVMYSETGTLISSNGNNPLEAFGSDFTLGLVKESSTSTSVPCRVYGNQKWYTAIAKIVLANNIVKIYITVINSDNTIPDTLTVNYIFIPPLHFSIPFTNC